MVSYGLANGQSRRLLVRLSTRRYNFAMTSMSVSSARADMHELLDAVERGDEVTLTRYGTAVAVVVRPDLLRVRRASATLASATELSQLLNTARSRPLPTTRGLSVQRADELASAVNADRSGR